MLWNIVKLFGLSRASQCREHADAIGITGNEGPIEPRF